MADGVCCIDGQNSSVDVHPLPVLRTRQRDVGQLEAPQEGADIPLDGRDSVVAPVVVDSITVVADDVDLRVVHVTGSDEFPIVDATPQRAADD